MRRLWVWLIALALVVAVSVPLAYVAYTKWLRRPVIHATAYFPRTVAFTAGEDVRVLGMTIGQVNKVTPGPSSVRVDFQYDAQYDIPADAHAVIINPGLAGVRYLQLTPTYSGGPVLRDGAQIPLARTAVPVEWNQILESLNRLSADLGPKGANKDGALGALVKSGAVALDGQGAQLNQALQDVSKLVEVLGDNRADLFGTLTSAQKLVSVLAEEDPRLRSFIGNFAAVSTQLAGDREDLGVALRNLSTVIVDLTGFIRDNKGRITTNVTGLSAALQTVIGQQDALRETLDMLPALVSNLHLAYSPDKSFSVRPVNLLDGFRDPGLFLCSLASLDGTPVDCRQFQALNPLLLPVVGLRPLPGPNPDVAAEGVSGALARLLGGAR